LKRKLIWIIPLSIILLLGFSACGSVNADVPTTSIPVSTLTSTPTSDPDLEAISKAFRIAGVSGQLIGYDKVITCYIIQWTDGKSIYQTTYADGTLTGTVKQGDLPTSTPTP
jgi:hypothetical protein